MARSFVGLDEDSFRKLDDLISSGGGTDPEAIAEAVHNELVAHPEWTTTVEDGSITGPKIANGAVTGAKLAQDVKGKFATLNGAVFSNVTDSGVVVELKDCVEIVSVNNMADGLTCVGGDNLLPAAVAQTVDKNGVTLTTDGSGTYTATRVSESQSGAMFLIELPTTVCMPHVDVSYHLGNASASGNVSVGLYDANGSKLHDGAASPANRVMTYSDMGGKVVRYVGIYCTSSFTGSFTISPMVMLTNVQHEFVPFVGASSAVGSLPSVPDGNMSRIWSNAATETSISVTYTTRDGGLSSDVARLGEIGSQRTASGDIVTLDHPSYIDGISAVATGEPYDGTVTVIGGENMLPPSAAQSVPAEGVTITSDGSGGYTLTGTATAGKNTQLALATPITLPASGQLYLHLRNDAPNTLTTIGLADSTGANIGQFSYAASPANRVVELPSVFNGKTVAYLSVYHTNAATYSTPMHMRPIVKTTADADGTEAFEGVTSGAGDTVASVPSNSHCYVYAADGTPINVAYTVGTDYALAEVDELRDTVDVVSSREVVTALKNARHIPRPDGTEPLTLLHFSDIHADVAALGRIMAEARSLGGLVDGAICTGDLTSNSYGQIADWWDSDVMTCIGNHDTASYNTTDGYDWTALSMADRDAYYIAPFESNWGITHTAGTSYYYKDYAAAKVRLIVIDCMLYLGESTASQAATQTAWLASLLDDATTNGLHVVIATHAPHDGARSVACSFSGLTQYTAALDTSSNTPQAVIDAVATAIEDGLNFVGYLIGHLHQDYICDAEMDGKQLMYSVTCASVAYASQWNKSDQSRDTEMDAYNLVTIDTKHKLVKLVRGGGADMDNAMRPRKAICINYGTGTIVGQTL